MPPNTRAATFTSTKPTATRHSSYWMTPIGWACVTLETSETYGGVQPTAAAAVEGLTKTRFRIELAARKTPTL